MQWFHCGDAYEKAVGTSHLRSPCCHVWIEALEFFALQG